MTADIRKLIVERFNGDIKWAIKTLHPLLDRDTVRRLFSPDYHGKFSKQTLDRLRWYLEGGPERNAYHNLLARVGIPDYTLQATLADWIGEYHYFRYFARTGRPDDIAYNDGRGRIVISSDNGLPIFQHWSHSVSHEGAPEHTGYIYKSETTLFMLGIGYKKMRLSIADVVADPQREPIIGIVLSQKDRSPYTAFSARFIMVHKNNRKDFERLADDTPFQLPNGAASTVGEEAFHSEAGGGAYAFFMQAQHH